MGLCYWCLVDALGAAPVNLLLFAPGNQQCCRLSVANGIALGEFKYWRGSQIIGRCYKLITGILMPEIVASIKEIKGNIFASRQQTIVNAVNCDGVMGKGIALEFRHRFPCAFEAYRKVCDKKLLRPGLVQLIRNQEPWILNFPTKDHWKQPSQLGYITSGLRKFALTYKDNGVKSIAFPRLGVSLGGLDWADVRAAMYEHLEPLSDLLVEIYEFDPGAPDALFDSIKGLLLQQGAGPKILGITPKKFSDLLDGVETGRIRSMLDIAGIRGMGEKSLEKIYSAAGKQFNTGAYGGCPATQMSLL